MRTENRIDNINYHKQRHLNREPEKMRHHLRNRYYQPREIHLSEKVGIRGKSLGNLGQALREIVPQTHTGKIEQRLRDAIGRDARHAAEYDDVNASGNQWRDEIPPQTEDRLLELHQDVTLDEQPKQILLRPDLLQIKVEQLVLGFYLCREILHNQTKNLNHNQNH